VIDLARYPLCAKSLHFQRVNLAETGFTTYWAAACVAGEFTDEALEKFGGFNFDDRSDENGQHLLARLELMLVARQERSRKSTAKRQAHTQKQEDDKLTFERVTAFLGTYGLKPSQFVTHEDYWTAASALWPGKICKPAALTMSGLLAQITAIPKKERSSLARRNFPLIPQHKSPDRRAK
jgi:hypothetical protein